LDFAPDYGLWLKRQGKPPDFQLVLIPFGLFALGVDLPANLYTTTSDTDVDGVPHALTLDFDRETFDQTVALLPEEFRGIIEAALEKDPSQPYLFKFPTPVQIVVTAGFGEMQTNDDESYVPMKVLSVRKYE
jgi:hypothetical protein